MIGHSQDQSTETPEIASYQHKTVRLRFLGQLCGALTGATFLAVLGVLGDALIKVQVASAVTGGATGIWAGLAAINPMMAVGLMGIGLVCAYLSTTFYQKAQILDSDFNAKKIAAATRKAKDAPETQIAVEVGRERENNKNKPLSPIINTQEISALQNAEEAVDESEELARERAEAARPDHPRTRIHDAVALDKVHGPEQALTIH